MSRDGRRRLTLALDFFSVAVKRLNLIIISTPNDAINSADQETVKAKTLSLPTFMALSHGEKVGGDDSQGGC